MQISRRFLVACAAACATTLAARGNDTPAQIKAREAMRQKLLEGQTQAPATAPQPPQPAPVVAPAPAVPPTAPVAVAVSAAPDAPVPPPAPAAQQADPESIAKARAALHQKLEDSPAVPPVTPTPPAAPSPPPVAVVAAPAPALATQVTDSETIAKAREAVRQRIAEDSEVGPRADSESIAKAREAVRQRTQSIAFAETTSLAGNPSTVNFPPLVGPPLPISSDKQQRLYDLLQRYKADQVTPEQYQAERAKILAAP
jgi:hypothetical protein